MKAGSWKYLCWARSADFELKRTLALTFFNLDLWILSINLIFPSDFEFLNRLWILSINQDSDLLIPFNPDNQQSLSGPDPHKIPFKIRQNSFESLNNPPQINPAENFDSQ